MKNILKRIIIGVAVTLIVSILCGCDIVNAESGSVTLPNSIYRLEANSKTLRLQMGGTFSNWGKGEVILSFAIPYGPVFTNTITGVSLNSINGINYNCVITSSGINDIGNYNLFSARCPVDYTSTGLNIINIMYNYAQSSSVQQEFIMINQFITFIENNDDNTNIINAINANTNYLRGQLAIFQSQFGIIDGHIVDISTIIQQGNNLLNQKLQEQITTQQETNEKLQETNDFLKDTSSPSSSDMDFSSNNASNGVITDLITMPISLVRAFLNGFNSSCSPFVLGNLLGTDLSLPCINIGQHLGVVWNMIDIIISGLFIYTFGKKCVKIFNDITNMKENQIDEVFD